MGILAVKPRAMLVLLPIALSLTSLRADDSRLIENTIKELKKQAEAGKQTLPWCDSICDGLQKAKEESRPVFLFTYEGDLERGRC